MRTLSSLPSLVPGHLALLFRRAPGQSADDVGRVGFRVDRVQADRERLAAYRALVQAPADGALPLLYPQLLAAPLHLAILADGAFPFRPLGLVHLENLVERLRPLADATALALEAELLGAHDVSAGVVITLETRAFDGAGLAYRSSIRALVRLRPKSSDEESSGPKASEARSARPRTSGEPTSDLKTSDEPTSSQNTVGQAPRTAGARVSLVEVPEWTGRAYARIAGDLNPIHQHAVLARPFGFPRAIVHGTYMAARALYEATEGWPPSPDRLDLRFRAPVYLPARVEVHALALPEGGLSIEARDPRDGKHHLEASYRAMTRSEVEAAQGLTRR